MGARRCGIVMGGASPTFNYDYVAHMSARTRPSPSLLLGYVIDAKSDNRDSGLICVSRARKSLTTPLFRRRGGVASNYAASKKSILPKVLYNNTFFASTRLISFC